MIVPVSWTGNRLKDLRCEFPDRALTIEAKNRRCLRLQPSLVLHKVAPGKRWIVVPGRPVPERKMGPVHVAARQNARAMALCLAPIEAFKAYRCRSMDKDDQIDLFDKRIAPPHE